MLPLYFVLLLLTLSPSVDGMHKKYGMDDVPEMAPIHVRDFEHAAGIQKRSDASPFDYMVPSGEAHLTYGRPGSMLISPAPESYFSISKHALRNSFFNSRG
jgi:hypothetical protein